MLGRLDGSIQTLPDAELFMYVRKEAVLSSQIEGTQSSLHDVLNAEAGMVGTGQPKDVHEVINYVKAMNYGLERLNDLPLCTRLVKEIHEQLLHGVRGGLLRPGELRRSQSWIGPTGCSLRDAHFVPPPPHEIGNLLSDLEKFVHSPGDLPALVWIGIVHAQFETIHPFLDGNGRVGRLLITFLLCQQEILLKPVLYLSYFFKKFRQEYYERLQMVRDAGDWEGWLAFFLQGVIEVSTEATQTARRIVEQRHQILNRADGVGREHTQRHHRSAKLCVIDPHIDRRTWSSGVSKWLRSTDCAAAPTAYTVGREISYLSLSAVFEPWACCPATAAAAH